MFVPSLSWQIEDFEYQMASQKWRFSHLDETAEGVHVRVTARAAHRAMPSGIDQRHGLLT
jgi:hypothetical protein